MLFHNPFCGMLALIVLGLPLSPKATYADDQYILSKELYVTGVIESVISTQEVNEHFVVQVSRDTFVPSKMVILIPKGTRLICSSQPEGTKLTIECSRALIAGGMHAEIYAQGEALFRGALILANSEKTLPQASKITLQVVENIYFQK